MSQQLILLDDLGQWQLDDSICEIGRRGLAEARAMLASARTHRAEADHSEHRLAA